MFVDPNAFCFKKHLGVLRFGLDGDASLEPRNLRLRYLFVKTDWVCHVWCNF